MRTPPPRRRASESGQATAEYTVMLALLLGVTVTLTLLMAVFSEHCWRLISLVGLEHP